MGPDLDADGVTNWTVWTEDAEGGVVHAHTFGPSSEPSANTPLEEALLVRIHLDGLLRRRAWAAIEELLGAPREPSVLPLSLDIRPGRLRVR